MPNTTDTTAPNTPSPYDINRDGHVSVADAVILARLLSEDDTLNTDSVAIELADIDGDQMLTILDVRILLRRIAEM